MFCKFSLKNFNILSCSTICIVLLKPFIHNTHNTVPSKIIVPLTAILECISACGTAYLHVDVYKPARGRFGPFGAILLTFMASSILHVSIYAVTMTTNSCLYCVYFNF